MKIFNIAHRGASAYEPDNTIAAFKRAVEMGADMVELDVHKTNDGEIVVTHDFNVMTKNGSRSIEDLNFDEIKRLRKNHDIPTLTEVLESLEGIDVYVEIKSGGFEKDVLNILEKSEYVEKAIIGSFDHRIVKRIKELDSRVRTAVLEASIPVDLLSLARNAEADYLHLCWERRAARPHTLLTKKVIEAIKEQGLGIIIWHEENEEALEALCGLDVDGICTNKPDLLAKIKSRKKLKVETK